MQLTLEFLDISEFEPKRIEASWSNPRLSPTLKRERDAVAQRLIGIQTDNELANLLEIPVGQLLHILYEEKKRYHEFYIKKKSGQLRVIESPNKSLKILQHKVKPLIEYHYRVKKSCHGFVGNGKGIVSNAEKHKKKQYVLNIDLKDFFHSVHFGRVRGIFMNVPFNMGNSAASVLAQLCTNHSRLPQGAPTSPVLSNLAASSLDTALTKIAKRYHLTYTRYADDITFSSNRKFPLAIVDRFETDLGKVEWRVGSLLRQSIEESGFTVNDSKTRVQHRSQRQEVTGLVVNDGVNVSRKFIRNTRAMLNSWSKDLVEAERRFLMTRYHMSESEIDSKKLDGRYFKNAIYGRLSFIKMIRGEDNSSYLTLCKKILELEPSPPKSIAKLKERFEMYDVFVCHASEDKDDVAIPLHRALEDKGIKAFIDCFEIKWGDSLVAKINTALQKSKYVVAIISQHSVNKAWPMKELNAVLSSEIDSKQTKLLPLIVGDQNALIEELPLLADKLFKVFDDDIDQIASELEMRLK
ncbi:TIR domain-containing protein [Neiella sp. HB171785]|uniref:RNA-directed DNA polymerase n=1 Tax=Neiella litorisoli TaxID=2771431 RepID=A0A8J6QGW0_9GAMM|nr:TIR domain-containing anti-phage reverse transcriptase [Neiella litorisoli]MBD1389255.1 TIR domain-containing protein [Neiella litorisoli]